LPELFDRIVYSDERSASNGLRLLEQCINLLVFKNSHTVALTSRSNARRRFVSALSLLIISLVYFFSQESRWANTLL